MAASRRWLGGGSESETAQMTERNLPLAARPGWQPWQGLQSLPQAALLAESSSPARAVGSITTLARPLQRPPRR